MSTDSNNPASDDHVAGAGNQGQHQAGDGAPGHHDQEIHAEAMKTVQLFLPYSSQGDDLSECVEDAGNLIDGLEAHADLMDLAAEMLRAIQETVAGHEVSIEADGDRILVTGPADVIWDLRQQGLAASELDEDVDVAREEIKHIMRDLIDREVAVGFVPQDDIGLEAVDDYSGHVPFPILRPISKRLAKIAIKKHMEEQATWPAVTDFDRLDRAFAELEQHGIMCRQDYHSGWTAGHASMLKELLSESKKGREIRGYCFHSERDTDVVLKHGLLLLAFGPKPAAEEIPDTSEENRLEASSRSSASEQAAIAVGLEIVGALQRHGLNAHWSGSLDERIQIQMDWKRRREPQTPAE